MKYTIKHMARRTFIDFENGMTVCIDQDTKEWYLANLRRPTLEDIQAVIGIVLEVLTLPVATEDEK